MSTHFTAVLEVHKVENTDASGYNKQVPGERTTAEVARVVIRADNLTKLQAKLAAHVALIEN
jgi:hypothetical protein